MKVIYSSRWFMALCCGMIVLPLSAQTRIRGGLPSEEGDLTVEQFVPIVTRFWSAIGRGRIEPSAIKWRIESKQESLRSIVVMAGGALLTLRAKTGNLGFFVDYNRRREQRARNDAELVSCFANAQQEKDAAMAAFANLGITDGIIKSYKRIGLGSEPTENGAKRFVLVMKSALANPDISIIIDRKDGHVTEMFAGPWTPGFHMCPP